jgi:dTDP-4-dehydrorhamnose reductase
MIATQRRSSKQHQARYYATPPRAAKDQAKRRNVMKVMVIGANGQLGSDLVKVFSEWQVIPIKHMDFDICDHAMTHTRITEVKPDVVINTAAFHRVDDCEDRPEKAFAVNTVAVRHLAQVCAAVRCTLVHVSTDYVFGSDQRAPYTENDVPSPLNVYGVSKLAGEYFVRTLCPKHFIARTTGLYGLAGSSGKGGNFVELMIRLAKEGKPIKVVHDQVLTPTSTKDLALKIKDLVQTEAYGLYHLTNSSGCSWYEFAAKIFQLTGLHPNFEPTTSAAFPTKARRPSFSVLAHTQLPKAGLADMRPWPEALADYLQEKGHTTTRSQTMAA